MNKLTIVSYMFASYDHLKKTCNTQKIREFVLVLYDMCDIFLTKESSKNMKSNINKAISKLEMNDNKLIDFIDKLFYFRNMIIELAKIKHKMNENELCDLIKN